MTSRRDSIDNSTIPASSYVIVTPVKDEAAHIGDMIKSVLAQTKRPDRWVIVDDGSTDQTSEFIAINVQGIAWITVLNTKSTLRNLGSAEIIAFNKGLDTVLVDDFDFIVKLDGDVKIDPDYFQKILTRMEHDESFGIISGVYREMHDGNWVTIKMPFYHAAGASKIVRRECYKAIGGFVPQKGWDTVDEIRAGLHDWKTGHFEDIIFVHLKPEGIAMGKLNTHYFHGEIYYQTGGGILFLLAKSVHRMLSARPLIICGLTMITGYLMSLVKRKQRLVNKVEARFYRNQLNKRLLKTLLGVFQFNNP
ncbi:MAG: glycosyltransferase family A protein [Methylobacter sp.]|nr:glycosyltransferase family A protein [Methylobacter sp.]